MLALVFSPLFILAKVWERTKKLQCITEMLMLCCPKGVRLKERFKSVWKQYLHVHMYTHRIIDCCQIPSLCFHPFTAVKTQRGNFVLKRDLADGSMMMYLKSRTFNAVSQRSKFLSFFFFFQTQGMGPISLEHTVHLLENVEGPYLTHFQFQCSSEGLQVWETTKVLQQLS